MKEYRPFFWEEKKKTEKGMEYLVRLADFVLQDEKGTDAATMFSTSYIGLPERKEKPVIFAYNGGPGAPSSWLHMGLLGPMTIDISDYPDVKDPAVYSFGENREFLADICDLVLIDPVGTSYTQVLEEGAEKAFYSVGGDGKAFVMFVENWLSENSRKTAPVYLLGESYGTIRNVVLADGLSSWVNLRGIISIGTSLNVGARGSLPVEPNVRRLGASAAACRYHLHPEADEDSFIAEAMEFAYGDYAKALLLGNRLDEGIRGKVLEKLAYYSGMPRDLLIKNNLRFSEIEFLTQLCPGSFVSMYDSRMTLPLKSNPCAEGSATVDIVIPAEDQEPFVHCVGTSIDECLESYYSDLAKPEGRFYQNDSVPIEMEWDYAGYDKNTLQLPADLMKERTSLRFLFINGRYDLSSTFDFMTYYLSQYDLPKERIKVSVQESGHASYFGENQAAIMSGTIREFIREDEKKDS